MQPTLSAGFTGTAAGCSRRSTTTTQLKWLGHLPSGTFDRDLSKLDGATRL